MTVNYPTKCTLDDLLFTASLFTGMGGMGEREMREGYSPSFCEMPTDGKTGKLDKSFLKHSFFVKPKSFQYTDHPHTLT